MATLKANYQSFKTTWRAWLEALQKPLSDSPPRMALLWGNSEYLSSKVRQKSSQIWKQLNCGRQAYTWDARQLSAKDIERIFYQTSLFAPRELHIITELSGAGAPQFAQWLSKAGNDITSGDIQHHVLWALATKTAHPPKSYLKHLPQPEGMNIIACALRSYELLEFSKDLCQSFSVAITLDALRSVIEHSGEQPHHIEQTLASLRLLAPTEHTWKLAEVLKVIDASPERVVFRVIDHLLLGERLKAELALGDLLESGTAVPVILGALHYHIKQLTLLLSLRQAGKPLPPYQRRRYARSLRSIDEATLLNSLAQLASIDTHFKSQKSSPAMLQIMLIPVIEALSPQ